MTMRRSTTYRRKIERLNIPAKANRILNVILVAMLLIVFRIWHLSVVQNSEKLEELRRSERRVIREPSRRATITDRFNIPLAINKIQYNIAIQYPLIKQIPIATWEYDRESGKKKKVFARKAYITTLSHLLAKELDMEGDRIEDLIYAKAAFNQQVPFILKEDITEEQYYRLKMLEKDWQGILAQHIPKRNYPQGQVAGDLIGYMGAINSVEYEAILNEIKDLEEILFNAEIGEADLNLKGIQSIEQAKSRLKDLQELSYTLTDAIGKTGIEARFEKILKGYPGKKVFFSDAKGNFLKEMPEGHPPTPGKQVTLSISSELQRYAEELLIANEEIRVTRLSRLQEAKKTIIADKTPWIKGGAIVAMDPNTGDILALASHPRLDPNDFIRSGNKEISSDKNQNVSKWLENETYLEGIWDQKIPLVKEGFAATKGIFQSEKTLDWETFLDFVLAKTAPLKDVLRGATVKEAITIQRDAKQLMQLTNSQDAYTLFNILFEEEETKAFGKAINIEEKNRIRNLLNSQDLPIANKKQNLKKFFSQIQSTYDKVLAIDLMGLLVQEDAYPHYLDASIEDRTLSFHKEMSSAFAKLQEVAKKMATHLFHDLTFKEWRKDNEKNYLKQKREEEKKQHRYAKPYLDYLDAIEQEMFKTFWEKSGPLLIYTFLHGKPTSIEKEFEPFTHHYLQWYHEIAKGAHAQIEWNSAYKALQEVTKPFSEEIATNYFKSLRNYKSLTRVLLGNYKSLKKERDGTQQEHHLAQSFYPKLGFGYGRSQGFRQAATQGSIFKLITAYEALIQRYNALKEEGQPLLDLNPLEITDAYQYRNKDLILGFHKNGEPIPRMYKGGRLPKSASANLGKMDILRAIETSSNPYFAILAADVIKSPNDLLEAAKGFSYGSKTGIDLPGEISGKMPTDLLTNKTGLYATSIGQHTLVVTPLQTAIMLSSLANGGAILKPNILKKIDGKVFATEIKRQIFLPEEVRKILIDGMAKVAQHTYTHNISPLKALYKNYQSAISDFIDMKNQLIGKTSTSESVETIDLSETEGQNLYTHVWFGGISYEDSSKDAGAHKFLFRNEYGAPELVVVVYLRYGGFGKEAAPLAAQIAKKWRSINSHKSSN